MTLKIQFGDGAVALPARALECNADLMELRVLLFLCSDSSFRNAGEENLARLAKAAGCETGAVMEALAFWRGAGILEYDTSETTVPSHTVKPVRIVPQEELPDYTGTEIERLENESGGRLKGLIDATQSIVGKIFNPTEISKIVGLSDYLRLEDEYILLLTQYCVSQDKKSVAYISKMAYGLFNDGIDDYPKLDAYIKYREKYNSVIGRLRKLLGLGDRALTKKENGIIKHWIEEMNLEEDVIRAAFDTTVDCIGKLSLDYMAKVLETWKQAGVKTAEDAERVKQEWRAQKQETPDKGQGYSSFDTKDFFDAALKRSMEALEKGV